MGEDLSRRDLIRHSSTGIAAVGIAGLAGCTASVPFIGGGDYENAAIGDWLVSQSFSEFHNEETLEEYYEEYERVETAEPTHSFTNTVPEAIFDNEDELDGHRHLQFSSVTDFRERVGVSAVDVEWQLHQAISWDWLFTHSSNYNRETTVDVTSEFGISILSGSFDPDTIEDTLEHWADDDDEFSSSGQYEGYDFYEYRNTAFAVHDDSIIQVEATFDTESGRGMFGSETPGALLDVLELVIDASTDGSPRLTEEDDGNELLSQFDTAHINSGSLHAPLEADEDDSPDEIDDWESGLVGKVQALEIDGSTTNLLSVYLYDSERDAITDDLEDHIERNRDVNEKFSTLEDYSLEEDGRSITVTGSIRTKSV